MKKLMLIILAMTSMVLADDIYLKNGKVIKNVQIIEIKSDYIIAKTTDGKEYNFVFENILKIDKKEFDPAIETTISDYDKSNTFNIPGTYEFNLELKKDKKKIYPYIKLIPISFVCWFLSWDYLKKSADIKKEIDYWEKLEEVFDLKYQMDIDFPTAKLKSNKARYDIIGYSMIGLGILNLSFSFQSVEVKIIDNQFYLSYNF